MPCNRYASAQSIVLLFASSVLLFSCASHDKQLCQLKLPLAVSRIHTPDCPKAEVPLVPYADNYPFDWQHKGPLDFLAVLETGYSQPNTGACWVTCKHPDWVKKTDVPALIALLDCRARCRDAALSTKFSSQWGPGGASVIEVPTTIDFQALVMLESYRAGYYPYLEDASETFAKRREAFLSWWSQQQ